MIADNGPKGAREEEGGLAGWRVGSHIEDVAAKSGAGYTACRL